MDGEGGCAFSMSMLALGRWSLDSRLDQHETSHESCTAGSNQLKGEANVCKLQDLMSGVRFNPGVTERRSVVISSGLWTRDAGNTNHTTLASKTWLPDCLLTVHS